MLPLHHRAVLAPDPKTRCAKEDEQARTYGNPGGATRRTRTDTRSLEGCWATITQVLHNDSAPEGLRVHPTVLSTKIAAGSYPDHSNVDIANRVKLAECGGIDPPRRCRRPELSKPVPYLSGNTPHMHIRPGGVSGISSTVLAHCCVRREPFPPSDVLPQSKYHTLSAL